MFLRFLFQLESSNLDHQNSSYCILHPDYSNLQSRIRLFLHIAPFEKFMGTLGLQFAYTSFKLIIPLEVYFTHNFESLNLDE